MSRAVRHSSASAEHMTPLYVVEASRRALGGVIDVDPATTERANRDVGARFAYTAADNGLRREWHGRVFLNPPGGSVFRSKISKSRAVIWWAKLALEWSRGRTEAAVFVCFSIEILQAAQQVRCVPQPLDFPFCVPDHRIPFDKLNVHGERVSQKEPSHSNAIIYLPGRDDPSARRFREAFRKIGRVIA